MNRIEKRGLFVLLVIVIVLLAALNAGQAANQAGTTALAERNGTVRTLAGRNEAVSVLIGKNEAVSVLIGRNEAVSTLAERNETVNTLAGRNEAVSTLAGLNEQERALAAELLDWDVRLESARQDHERLTQEIPVARQALKDAEAGLNLTRERLRTGQDKLGRWLNFLYR